jgi:molybdate transport system substrate-binding protein
MTMELNILSAGAAKGLVQALQDGFHSSAGASVSAKFGAVGAIQEQMDAGSPCDVIILTGDMIDKLDQAGRVVPGSIAPMGRVETGVAVRSGEALPPISNRAELSAALSKAKAVYFPDPIRATAGIHFASVLKKLGIYDELEPRFRTFPSGAITMANLSQTTEADFIGCTQVTEIIYTDGVTMVGLLPKEFELATMYSAAVSKTAANPELAQAFIDLMTGEKTRKMREDGGFVI